MESKLTHKRTFYGGNFMKINLSMFLSVIDGGEVIRIADYNNHRTMFEGKKVMCPFFDVDVIGVWTNNGKIIIEVA